MILTCSDLDSLSSPQDLLDCRHGLDCRRPPPCLYDQEREPHGSPSIWPASAAGHPGRLPGHGTELLPPTAPPHHRCVGRSRCTCRVSYRGTERGKSGTPSSNVGSKFFVAPPPPHQTRLVLHRLIWSYFVGGVHICFCN